MSCDDAAIRMWKSEPLQQEEVATRDAPSGTPCMAYLADVSAIQKMTRIEEAMLVPEPSGP